MCVRLLRCLLDWLLFGHWLSRSRVCLLVDLTCFLVCLFVCLFVCLCACLFACVCLVVRTLPHQLVCLFGFAVFVCLSV